MTNRYSLIKMISELLDERHTTPIRVCCICLDDCEETAVMKSPIYFLPCSCKDIVVHKDCFDTWFDENHSCPICRTKIRRTRGPHSHPPPNDCPKSYVIAGVCGCVISINLLAWLIYSVCNNTNTDQNNANNSYYNGFVNGK